MASLLQRLRRGEGGAQPSQQAPRSTARRRRGFVYAPSSDDPNVPKKRLQIHQRCLYERTLPGNAFISAHVNRLQHGYYHSSALHESVVDNVYFVSVHFVFHPHEPRSHRFKSARIQVCVGSHEDTSASVKDAQHRPHARILKHAPVLMFGAVSPENLQWNFSLSSSLGVSQAPVSASLNPSGGIRGSYKVFHMMSIQGSVRSKKSPLGPDYDVQDAMAVWTLEENGLQKSGLPREFDFVMLIHKPDDVENLYMAVNVDADINAWYGSYPQWYTNLSRFMPNQDSTLDFRRDIGQQFLPRDPERGFNFGSLPHSLDEYVIMPGTVYPTNDTKPESETRFSHVRTLDRFGTTGKATEVLPLPPPMQEPTSPPGRIPTREPVPETQSKLDRAHETVNVRVILEHQYPQGLDPRRFAFPPRGGPVPAPHPSIRRRKSRSGLKDYGATQALHEMVQLGNKVEERRMKGVHPLKEVT